ncbi:Zinc finger protein 91 [Plakobranchus ocellatus]|uniref:Zinc finger protein 91 n=1 Tax=Plakobranchus ocellatus TaxID=259542 RepID=A0AAV3ZS62_9GAST|nr:Zinc finger protein 91 [Plakobranchus ocellatus]
MSEEETTEVGPNDIVIHLVNPYKCGICELEFLEKSVFKDHMFSHLEQIKQERPSSQMVMTIALPPETPGGVTVTRDILQLGEDGSIKQVLQPPSNITLNQVQPLRELEEAGVIKLEPPKPATSLLRSGGPNENLPIISEGQTIVPQDLVPVVAPAPQPLIQGRVGSVTGQRLESQSLLKDTLVKSGIGEPGEGVDVSNSAFIPNKDGTFSFAFKGSNEEMQHIQIIRSDGIKTEVLMELGSEKEDMMRPLRTMRVAGRMSGTNKNNQCDLCGKVLSSSTNLLRHKMYHSSERPFVCEVCNKGFKDISNLKKHTQIHKRIFPCYLCKKSFLRKSQLEVHLRRHESRTTFVKTGNSSKEVSMRTFVDVDGTRVEEMSMTALGGQTFEYKNRIVKADASGLEDPMKQNSTDNTDPINSVLDSSATTESLLETEQGDVGLETKSDQIEGEKPVDKIFTVTMEGLQETTVPVNAMNRDQPATLGPGDSAEELTQDIKFPPLPDDFVKVYQCGHCGKRTVQRGNMMRHLIHHLKDRPFSCDECSKRFVDKGELFKHKKTHTKPYRCPQCNGAFAHNVQLVKHLEKECLGNMENLNYTVMEDGQTYKCDICGVEMKRLGNMIKHVGTHKSGSNRSNWNQDAVFNTKLIPTPKSSPGKPSAPYFYDSSRRAFFCGFCSKSFWRKASVHRHIQFHIRNNDQYKCTECDKSFPSTKTLQRHALIHSKPFKCDLCPLAFSRKLFLEAHKRKHNASEVPVETADYGLMKDNSGYFCKHCNLTLAKKYRMMSHVKRHVSDRPHECPTCNKCFSASHLLIKHKKAHKKLFVCKKCGETFGHKFSLDIHLKRKHPQQQRFAIENLPSFAANFETKGDGSEKHPCSYCGAPFSRMIIKLNHEKKCREESKVVERLSDGGGYKCKICGKTATLKHNLMVHVRKHDSVKIIDTGGKIVLAEGTLTGASPSTTRKLMSNSAEKKPKKRKLSVAKSESDGSKEAFAFDDDSFEEEEDLEDDTDNRYKRTPGGYACVKCRRKFTDKDTLARHLETHEAEAGENVTGKEKENAQGKSIKLLDVEVTKEGFESKGEAHQQTEIVTEVVADVETAVSENVVRDSAPSEMKEDSKPKAQKTKIRMTQQSPKNARHKSTPSTQKIKTEPIKTPVVVIQSLEESASPIRSGGRPARAQKIPSRFLE